MTDWSKLSGALERQSEFSKLFFETDSLTTKQKEEVLKTLVLSLHSDATGIAEGISYKDHRLSPRPVDLQKILYKSVDVYRYVLAILNLWGISGATFQDALTQKDDFLHYRHRLSQKKWSGQPVVLFDVDDVLAEFRKSYCSWVTETTGCFLDPENTSYYATDVLKPAGLNNDVLFKSFIEQHGFLSLERDETYFGLLHHLQASGFWIQIVTARPERNLTAFYDTFSWLSRHGIDADGVAFTPEKFVFLTDQPYFLSGKYFAVDDSAKHAAEYARHGVPVLVPEKSYNREVAGLTNVHYVPRHVDPVDILTSLNLVSV